MPFRKTPCEVAGVEPCPVDFGSRVGLARSARAQLPIHGMRVRPSPGMTGWFIWAGEYSHDESFFEPVHAGHISDVCAVAVPFLELPPGWRFLADGSGYCDVWYDEALVSFDADR